jgi:putative transposase
LKEPFDLWAFVVMPEHAHMVLRPHDGSEISRILRFIKRPMTDHVLNWVRIHAPDFLDRMTGPDGERHFWQPGGGYDRNLRCVADVHTKIAYIHRNPIRRGLVVRPEDWPWSSCRAWRDGVDEPLRIDRESLPALAR